MCRRVFFGPRIPALAMIDDGDLDWKLICISADDPLADKLQDIEDVYTYFPGTVSGIREWFRWYKTPDNKPLSKFGHQEKVLSRAKAVEVIDETHRRYVSLMAGHTAAAGLWVGCEKQSKPINSHSNPANG